MAKNGKSGSNIFKSPDRVKWRGTTAKKEMNPAFYEELTFLRKRRTAQIVLEHNIYKKMILYFDQTTIWFSYQNKTTYTEKGSKSIPITNADNKHQITATFSVSLHEKVLPIQCIYDELTERCNPEKNSPIHFISLTQTALG